jgi:hypothetical protein
MSINRLAIGVFPPLTREQRLALLPALADQRTVLR